LRRALCIIYNNIILKFKGLGIVFDLFKQRRNKY
jgi:hypothetical protein